MSSHVPPIPSVPGCTLQAIDPPSHRPASSARNDDLEAPKSPKEAGAGQGKQALKEKNDGDAGKQEEEEKDMYASDLDAGPYTTKKRKNRDWVKDKFRKRMLAASLVAAEVSTMTTEEWFHGLHAGEKRKHWSTHGTEGHQGDSKSKKGEEGKIVNKVNDEGVAEIGEQSKEAGDEGGFKEDYGYAKEPKEKYKALIECLKIDGKKFRKTLRRLLAEDVWD